MKITNVVIVKLVSLGGKSDNTTMAAVDGKLNAVGNHHSANAGIFSFVCQGGVAFWLSFNVGNKNRNTVFILTVCT